MEIVFSQVPHSFSAQTIAENVFAKDPLDVRKEYLVSQETNTSFLIFREDQPSLLFRTWDPSVRRCR